MTNLHGTANNYFNGGCRCDECRAAAREYGRARRANRTPGQRAHDHRMRELQRERKMLSGNFEHGTLTGYYSYRCRCEPCVKASSDYQRERRASMSPEQKEARKKQDRERKHQKRSEMTQEQKRAKSNKDHINKILKKYTKEGES